MKTPDLSVFGIKLGDRESAASKIGSGHQLSDGEDDIPHVRFVSSNGAQELILFADSAAGIDEYTEIEVRTAGIEAITLTDLPTEEFVSGRGIELGMSRADIVSRFGTCMKSDERIGSTETIQYEIVGADRDRELKDFKYPVYFAEYELEHGKLVRYRFGFEAP